MSERQIDRSKPVLVTGATGYVAGWVVKRLLEEGLTVHGTVRNADQTERFQYLHNLAEGTEGSLKLFSANLTEAGSFAQAMAGCGTVLHVASPFQLGVEDPQRDLIEPAVEGTRNVLEEVNRTPSVHRVVLTSSCAAIYGDNIDLESTPDGAFTEEVWNTSSSLTHQPYSYSKTLAEKKAWEIHDAQDRWQLVVMNPPAIFGPGVRMHEGAESFNIMTQVGDGTVAMGAPRAGLGIVDVRDVAEAHLKGAFLPDAEGRHVISGHDSDLLEMGQIIAKKYPDYPLPKRAIPKFMIWLLAPFIDKAYTRKMVSRNVNLPWRGDNTKSREKLGMTYRPLETTLHDHFQQLIDEGVIGAKSDYGKPVQ
ncbi:MAG: NAD-dependent epimerase/dehydratase family protein [Woeseiaceae bacterium]|nr:NAD-dependent epimerase/dehydratase family protein [Woeseiaceae bacterium]